MGDPVSERAHYLTAESGKLVDLFLVQQGRREQAAVVPVIWSRTTFLKAERPDGATRPPSRLRRVLGRRLATIFSSGL
jgi:hypothetical protein